VDAAVLTDAFTTPALPFSMLLSFMPGKRLILKCLRAQEEAVFAFEGPSPRPIAAVTFGGEILPP
jgi:hypothetical protein